MARIETSLTATMPVPADIQKRSDLPSPEAVPPTQRVDKEATRKAAPEDDQRLLQEAIGKMNNTLETFDVQAQFSIDDRAKEVVVKIMNTRTHEVIRQIPPEHVLEMAASLREKLGLLLDRKI
ncbi:MAG: flagellar protein FlaG [Armatimonadetes bacterium]|nr:flagellar protein FlaG [Armatimonadota bacterium]